MASVGAPLSMNLERLKKMRKNGTEERNNSNFNEKERNGLINQNVITNPMRRLLRNKYNASISKVKEGHGVDY